MGHHVEHFGSVGKKDLGSTCGGLDFVDLHNVIWNVEIGNGSSGVDHQIGF